jgi:hypothetical protein
MSTKDPNMKVIFGSDTKDFEKGAKAVKQGLKDLDKSSESMLSSLSNAFGVPSQKVEQMTSAVRGLGYKLVETGSTGAKAFGSLLASIGPLQAGIAGLGIAAAIAGFKQLKAEADNFKSTIDGMNMSMATSAYISTYKQVLHDVNSDTGKAVAEAMDKWERGFGRFRANLGASLVTGMSDSKWYDAFLPTGIIRGWKTVREGVDEATAAAERNAARGAQLAEIQKEELQVRREVADIEVQIAEQRRILRDRSADAAERTAAEAEVRRLINERTEKQTSIAQRLYEVTQAMTDEAGSTYDEVANVVTLYEQWQGRIAASENELAGVDRYANSIANGTSKAAEAAKKLREETQKMAEVQAKWSGLGTVSTSGLSSVQGGVLGPSMSILPQRQDAEYFKQTFQAYLGDWQLSVGIKPQEGAIVDFTAEVEEGLVSMTTRTAEVMGNLIGTLAAGGDAWGEFKNAALSSLGDMAIAVGKIAIKTGVGMLGIQAALNMDNPYVAIAAGAALVALGAAVKSSLSSVASGDYSAGGGGYSGDYGSSGGGNGYETREVKVYVTGTLEADGDKLITVINNTNKKNYYTQ